MIKGTQRSIRKFARKQALKTNYTQVARRVSKAGRR